MEEILRRYFQAWIDADIDVLNDIFSDDVVYNECYGPEYHGLDQINKWFSDWNKEGRVLEWDIERTITQGSSITAIWYFKCDYQGTIDGFDGVTVADFDENGKITKLCEYQSKHDHYYPYGK